ncbi:MAG: HNH endonuclease, partial [Mycobacterium sp.]|nr:HNH endonuclease [Mycobacterium sp.]
NLSPKCRKHHLLKNFYGGPTGLQDRQLPDGSFVWTAPTGHTYTSVPGSRILFPDKIIDTPLPSTPRSTVPDLDAPQTPSRGVMMAVRRRTRAQDLAQRTAYERALNEADLQNQVAREHTAVRRREARKAAQNPSGPAQSTFTRQHPPAENDIPPPF